MNFGNQMLEFLFNLPNMTFFKGVFLFHPLHSERRKQSLQKQKRNPSILTLFTS